MTIPKFDFNPNPAFTQTLKTGDTVYLWIGSNYNHQPKFDEIELAVVKRVTPKFVIVNHPRIDGDEMKFKKSDRLEYGGYKFDSPSQIFPHNDETIAMLKELNHRKCLIADIKKASAYHLSTMLTTENLELIIKLIEGKQP